MGIYRLRPTHEHSFRPEIPLFLGKFLLHKHRTVAYEQSHSCGMHQIYWARGRQLDASCTAKPLRPVAHIWGGSLPQVQWVHLGLACLELVKQRTLRITAQHCHCHQASRVLSVMSQLKQEVQSVAWCFTGSCSLKQPCLEGQLGKVIKHKPEKSVLALSTLASITGMCTGQLHPSPVQVIAQNGETSWKTLDTCRGYSKKKQETGF